MCPQNLHFQSTNELNKKKTNIDDILTYDDLENQQLEIRC